MKSCGLIVEYNPFHNGHLHHLIQSKVKTNSDIVIAVMSGTFLQRGEPAIIDKFHRTKAALQSGIDVVLELPFAFSCQYADLFAKGAIMTLAKIGVESICFGSEHGEISPFIKSYLHFKENEEQFHSKLKHFLNEGLSFPQASTKAYDAIGMTDVGLDLSLPNNILGYSYVKAIKELKVNIKPDTIKRTKSQYHDEKIEHQISSATSIRKEILENKKVTETAKKALPNSTVKQLVDYKKKYEVWHHWELYFPLLQYLVQTKSLDELRNIQGVDEGLEYRLKQTAPQVESFHEWMEKLKTKRYTWTRLQRLFCYLLTNTKKEEIDHIKQLNDIPYVRILGMSENGRAFIQSRKKQIDVPLITNMQQLDTPILELEEKATNAYYSVIKPKIKKALKKQELTGPILL